MHSFLRQRISRSATVLLLATLGVRALLPLGYMPGNLLDGRFAELCPVASAATYSLLSRNASHQHHAHHGNGEDGGSYSLDSACPIGTSLLAEVLPGLASQVVLEFSPETFQQSVATHPYVARSSLYYPTRAPPLS